MLSFLSGIFSGIQWLATHFVELLKAGLFFGLNAAFLGISELVHLLYSLLPEMPSAPQYTNSEWVGWMNWFIPMSEILTGATILIGLYIAFMAIRFAMQFVRAL